MGSQGSFLKRLAVLLVLGGAAFLLVLFLFPQGHIKGGRQGRFVPSAASGFWSLSNLYRQYGQAWLQIQAKADALRKADEENNKLRLENAQLRLDLEASEFSCSAKKGSESTQHLESQLKHETGTKVGRAPAGIKYRPPANLVPSQLLTLATSYLKAKEDEKAAVILSTLAKSEEESVKTAKNLLAAGLAWYRIENYKLADSYFDEVLKKPENSESIQYHAQARLWKALVAKKFNQDEKVQYWLKELVDHHPHSAEAGWVNSKEAEHAVDHHH